MENIKITTVYN